jgi:hypothetical protein
VGVEDAVEFDEDDGKGDDESLETDREVESKEE